MLSINQLKFYSNHFDRMIKDNIITIHTDNGNNGTWMAT